MPLYDFECEFCGNKWEQFDTMNTSHPQCPSCTSVEDVVRLMGCIGFRPDKTVEEINERKKGEEDAKMG